ncbi:putative ribonuclease H-like domain-containing protein [Tanacetum coccineum]
MVNTVRGKKFNTARPKAVVNVVKGNNFNVVKASACWVWKPKDKVLDHRNPQMDLQDQGVIDSGCSRHMTGNMSYLTDYEEIDGVYVAFGGNPKGGKITGKGTIKTGNLDFENVYFVRELKFNLFSDSQMCDKKNSVLFNDTECIVLSSNFKLIDESQVLLRVPRKNNMYSVDLKNIVPKGGNLVRGLPSKLFENNQTCVACQKGKQHRASSKSKTENSISLPLHLLHMDLFGLTFVKSLMKKMYCLVVIDDYSRFTWVFFLTTTDETSGILKSFIRSIEQSSRSQGFMRPFGCPVTILNTIDHLGKFDGKADEGFFVGYSVNSKAFRVFNSRTRMVEENLHIRFSTQSNGFAGTKASDNADPKSSHNDGSKPSSDDGKNVDEDLIKDRRTQKGYSCIERSKLDRGYAGRASIIQVTRSLDFSGFTKWKRAIGSKWVFRNKKDERGIVIRNKARLVAQGYTQKERIDYDEVFAPVARIEAIRLFLAYASFKYLVVYQMDVKSAFLYGKIEEKVYVCQPPGFEDPEFPDRVYKKELRIAFEKLMHKKFQMSSMGELTFFLGLQVKQKKDGIFVSQDKYVDEILKKFRFTKVKTVSTPMETQNPLLKDEDSEEVDVHVYRSMIGSLMYLSLSRPNIMFAVCACARYQVNPKVSHLHVVKRFFRYLKGQPKLGLWYPKDSPFDLVAYTDSDYTRASLDRKSIIGGCQFLGYRLISWQCKKQMVVANSTTEAEYVAASSCCGQVKTFNREAQLHALVDGKKIIINESFVRRDLQLEDEEGVDCLSNSTIFEQLTLMGYEKV